MFRLIKRQRRRICLTAFFVALACFVFVSTHVDAWAQPGQPAWIFWATAGLTSLIIALMSAVVAIAIILVFPSSRTVCEIVALIVFAQAVVSGFFTLSPLVLCLFYFLGATLLSTVMYGEMLDRTRFWLDHKTRRCFVSDKTPEELWAILVPDPDHVATHWDPLLHDMAPQDEAPDSYAVRYNLGGSLYELQTVTFLERAYPTHARYHHVGEMAPKNRAISEGIYDIQIEVQADGRSKVAITHARTALLPRDGFLRWFDDSLGSMMDYIVAKERGHRDWSTAGHARRVVSAIS